MSYENNCQSCDSYAGEAESLKEEVHYLENMVSNLEHKLELKEIECDQVTGNLAEISAYVQELETALAEAHLMSYEGPKDDPVSV